jgi:D-aminopeptidase
MLAVMLRSGCRAAAAGLLVAASSAAAEGQQRPTARDLGVAVGAVARGPLNAITDVGGVRVGHTTIASGDSLNTGVTVVLPPGDNVFQRKVPAAVVVGNGFGKLVGVTQIEELGELESPIVLTCTLCVHRAADALVTYLLGLPGNELVRSVNVVVGETNDGFLNDIRSRPVQAGDVLDAIMHARAGPVEQGSVGAGRGTVAFGWKGGIGTASRQLDDSLGGWMIGVLTQTNFGGALTIGGAPVGRELGVSDPREPTHRGGQARDDREGSVMIVVATDAPIDALGLTRMARRALVGMARTGSAMSSGSGDYVIAFSTVSRSEFPAGGGLRGAALSPFFVAVADASEEAVYNSLLQATDVHGFRGLVRALPVDSTVAILQRYGVIPP